MSRPVAVITGASRGIGGAVAARLATDHRLVLLGRDHAALDAVAVSTGASGVELIAVDLTDHRETAARLAHLTEVDVLVHSAGIAPVGSVEDTPVEDWQEAFDVNVVAVVALTRALLPALRAAGGHLVAVNSGAGMEARPQRSAYAASKFALRAFTDALRAEEPGIRVTSVHPGRVDTDMQRGIVAREGGPYTPEAYLTAGSVADLIRSAVDAAPDAHPTELIVRPRSR